MYTLLGADVRQGCRWRPRKAKKSKRQGRMLCAARRHRRGSAIARLAGGRRGAKLFTAGTRPVATYAAEVSGIPSGTFRKLRRWGIAGITGMASTTSSLSAALLLDGDPCADASIACATRWAQEAWCSALDGRRLRLSTMAAAFENMGTSWPSTWRAVCGPMGAARLELGRLGWRWPSAF